MIESLKTKLLCLKMAVIFLTMTTNRCWWLINSAFQSIPHSNRAA